MFRLDTLNGDLYIIHCCTFPISPITCSVCLIIVSNHYIDPRRNLAWGDMHSLSTHASVTMHTLPEDLWDCQQSHWNGKVIICRMKLTAYKGVGLGWNQLISTKIESWYEWVSQIRHNTVANTLLLLLLHFLELTHRCLNITMSYWMSTI